MTNYKRPYFRLFCAVCDTIDALEQTAASKNCPETTAKLLSEQAKQLRKTLVISAEISYNKKIHKHFPAKNVRKPASIQQQSIRCCKRGST